MNLFVKNISQLVTVAARGKIAKTGADMRDIGLLTDAGVLCRDGKIAWTGPMRQWKGAIPPDVAELDASGMTVLPGFVDSHTHMMFAGSREKEFGLRAEGSTYQQIAEQGGGILDTIGHVRAAGKKALKRQTVRYMNGMMRSGTTTVEIKSGYGLDMDSEIKMLEAIVELEGEELLDVVPTFLGAHAVPPEYRGRTGEYVGLIVDTMIPYVGRKKLARFCDVFCEKGYFELDDAERVLGAARSAGMQLKLHADELTAMGGAELAARLGAVSADHLEHVSARGIAAMEKAGVVAGILPGVSFFLNHGYAPVRALIDGGVAVAIASDFNPGSCMSWSMPMMMTIACTQMRMTPEEAITATTLNGAAALGLSGEVGSIEAGKRADLIVADIPDYR
ncbi:MAG TPA: imidazolonepropionase, partial [Bacteroidota bacterium]|nr:imidazolonepropionase [Bacteroidota bacterium]